MIIEKFKETDAIDCDAVKELLGVTDLRTLTSTESFPKPFFNKDKLVFSKELILKYFNVDNLDEPFISTTDAAEYLGVKSARLAHLALDGKIPSYKLKHAKGSGYLFRKSELTKFREIQIEGNAEYVNHMVANHLIKDTMLIFLNKFYKDNTENRDYRITYAYLFEGGSYEFISKEYDLTRERIRQIIMKTLARVKKTNFCTYAEYLDMQKKIQLQEMEINRLQEARGKDNSLATEAEGIASVFIQFLSKPLADIDLTVRALNCCSASGVKHIFELLPFCTNNFRDLRKFKNMGKKTVEEFNEFISDNDKRLIKETGVSLWNFINNKPLTPLQVVVFETISKKLAYFKF